MSVKTNKNNIYNGDLSDSDLLRYNKHVLLDEINEIGQKKLLDSHVALIGLGGLGCPVAIYLATSGVGKISIFDHDDIDLSNLQRQILFDFNDVGKKKADVVSKKISSVNPSLLVSAFKTKIDENFDTTIIKTADLVIDATDNYKSRTLINKITLKYRIPLIMGSAIKFTGQVALFRNDLEDQPCYNCLYNIKDDEKSCLDLGVLSSLTGIIGSIQATEAIKFLTNFGEKLESKLMIIDIKQNEFRVVRINRDNKCEFCNDRNS